MITSYNKLNNKEQVVALIDEVRAVPFTRSRLRCVLVSFALFVPRNVLTFAISRLK